MRRRCRARQECPEGLVRCDMARGHVGDSHTADMGMHCIEWPTASWTSDWEPFTPPADRANGGES